ncbi:RNA polymerase sigma 70 [Skermanella stibiiresistens SB22]|uniref:RNA polymerase sigma factor RpoH n=1 Tax=Skermanella stibiiresistens SB22 TaxID=1385369 RepID=W9GUE8_9PROT|nr:RNA polymerase sigma factor RpoH [Skermanella stibiiresistens]EWY36057.1 RNA polymerase sigma 70 [Skermanella stibiiresistens SB22]
MSIHTDDSLTPFIEESRRFKMLTAEEELDLGRRWRDTGDRAAMRLLVGAHLRLVIKMARNFAGYGLPIADLIAEGNVGLMQAVEKFDPERGFRFNTYAMWWIRAAMQSHVLHNWSMVKLGTTAAQKKLFFNLRRVKREMSELESGDLSPETITAIATKLEVAETDVVDMNRRLAAADSSLNAVTATDGEMEWQDLLVDQRPDQESIVVDADELASRRRLLALGMEKLNDRERRILVERRMKDEPATLEELSREYAVSRERVRQIEMRAFEKLQKAMLTALPADRGALPLAA